MNKYYDYNGSNKVTNNIAYMLMPDEHILWNGTPKKSAYVLNSSVKMLPIAIIWLLFDGFFIFSIFGSGGMGSFAFFLIPFFALHLMPVWIWLSNVLTASARWKNTEYAITDKRVLLRNGLIGYDYKSIYYTDISNVSIHVGAIDSMLGVGDIHISLSNGYDSKKDILAILDIENPNQVFKILQQAVMDIQTDIHYPNALRPETNPGYHTEYRQ